jgi:hypothetical protein
VSRGACLYWLCLQLVERCDPVLAVLLHQAGGLPLPSAFPWYPGVLSFGPYTRILQVGFPHAGRKLFIRGNCGHVITALAAQHLLRAVN